MAEPEIFRNQDAEYRAWIRAHPQGLVLNVKTLMLHRPYCDHIGDLMTKAPKVCADGPTAESDLRRWARSEKDSTPLRCETCET